MRALGFSFLAACASSAMPSGDRPDAGTNPQPTFDASNEQTGCTPQPLVATNEQWSWISVPGAKCGNGSSAGFAIHPTTRSRDVLIFLMGGGGCYSQQTCAQGLAANLNGYG